MVLKSYQCGWIDVQLKGRSTDASPKSPVVNDEKSVNSFVVGLVLALVGGIWAIGSYICGFEKPIALIPKEVRFY